MVTKVLRWLSILVVVVAGSWATTWLPTTETASRTPFTREGAIGQWVTLRTGQVRVIKVELATTVVFQGHSTTTEDLWLVAHLEVIPSTNPLVLPPLLVKDTTGRTFGDDTALRGSCVLSQPGLITSCSQLVELPQDALVGAKLWVPGDSYADKVPDDVAVIDLELDQDSASRLAAQAGTVELSDSTVVGAP